MTSNTSHRNELALLAKELAGNEQVNRDRALRKLGKFLSASNLHSESLSSENLLTLWKGLHYCLWMQDKPLLQEDLITQLVGLVAVLKDSTLAVRFLSAAFETEAREWHTLDRYRNDKFLMLVRRLLRAALELLKRHAWNEQLVRGLVSALDEHFVKPRRGTAEDPLQLHDGLRYHLADILLDELTTIAHEDLPWSALWLFLQPHAQLIASTNNKYLLRHTSAAVFDELVTQAYFAREIQNQATSDGSLKSPCTNDAVPMQVDESESDGKQDAPPVLPNVDHNALADHLLQLASNSNIKAFNRKILMNLVKKFKNLAGAVYSDDLLAGVSERSVREVRRSRKSRDEYRTRLALQRMSKFERKLRRKVPTRQELLSRRRRRRHELDDEDGDSEDDDVSAENAAGKRGPSSSRRAAFGVGEILDLADVEDVLADPELQVAAPPEAVARHSKRKRVRQRASPDDEDFTIEAE